MAEITLSTYEEGYKAFLRAAKAYQQHFKSNRGSQSMKLQVIASGELSGEQLLALHSTPFAAHIHLPKPNLRKSTMQTVRIKYNLIFSYFSGDDDVSVICDVGSDIRGCFKLPDLFKPKPKVVSCWTYKFQSRKPDVVLEAHEIMRTVFMMASIDKKRRTLNIASSRWHRDPCPSNDFVTLGEKMLATLDYPTRNS